VIFLLRSCKLNKKCRPGAICTVVIRAVDYFPFVYLFKDLFILYLLIFVYLFKDLFSFYLLIFVYLFKDFFFFVNLYDCHSSGDGNQVDDVILDERDHFVRTTLKTYSISY